MKNIFYNDDRYIEKKIGIGLSRIIQYNWFIARHWYSYIAKFIIKSVYNSKINYAVKDLLIICNPILFRFKSEVSLLFLVSTLRKEYEEVKKGKLIIIGKFYDK